MKEQSKMAYKEPQDELCSERAATTSFMGVREVNISPLDTGFVVRVGCQTVAISTKKQLIEELTKYYANPSEVEKRYYAEEFGDRNVK